MKKIFYVILLSLCILAIYFLLSNKYFSFCILGVLILFTILVGLPIIKNGWINSLFYMCQMNPLIRRITTKYLNIRDVRLSKQWLARVKTLSNKEIPFINWEFDEKRSQGINSFYCLDQFSDDVRQLLNPCYNVVRDRLLWFRSRFTNDYYFEPQLSSYPRYEIKHCNGNIIIDTNEKIDTWIYLVSKQKYPSTYAIEFDLTPHTEMEEMLQIDFCAHSLARRYRFNLIKNRDLTFEIIDKGCFTYCIDEKEWKKLKKECSLPLHKVTRIRLEVIENIYALYFNNELVMAVKVEKYVPVLTNWYIIFWNGIETGKKMNLEIGNFKSYISC